MSNEIPAEMIQKAAIVISELRETENGLVLSSHIAKLALEAAGVADLLAENAHFKNLIETGIQPLTDEAEMQIAELMERIAELETAGVATTSETERNLREWCDALERERDEWKHDYAQGLRRIAEIEAAIGALLFNAAVLADRFGIDLAELADVQLAKIERKMPSAT
jgi:hypothetical protein